MVMPQKTAKGIQINQKADFLQKATNTTVTKLPLKPDSNRNKGGGKQGCVHSVKKPSSLGDSQKGKNQMARSNNESSQSNSGVHHNCLKQTADLSGSVANTFENSPVIYVSDLEEKMVFGLSFEINDGRISQSSKGISNVQGSAQPSPKKEPLDGQKLIAPSMMKSVKKETKSKTADTSSRKKGGKRVDPASVRDKEVKKKWQEKSPGQSQQPRIHLREKTQFLGVKNPVEKKKEGQQESTHQIKDNSSSNNAQKKFQSEITSEKLVASSMMKSVKKETKSKTIDPSSRKKGGRRVDPASVRDKEVKKKWQEKSPGQSQQPKIHLRETAQFPGVKSPVEKLKERQQESTHHNSSSNIAQKKFQSEITSNPTSGELEGFRRIQKKMRNEHYANNRTTKVEKRNVKNDKKLQSAQTLPSQKVRYSREMEASIHTDDSTVDAASYYLMMKNLSNGHWK